MDAHVFDTSNDAEGLVESDEAIARRREWRWQREPGDGAFRKG